ncbi:MAG: V-type ATP synthase subunit I [Oscillospiraceae bacterium]|nr:V-type ATP synthase subunit I [Oscillospiraceae bacterium]
MAILKMKRLRLMIARSQKDELLRALIRLGCVQFSELEDGVQSLESLRRAESETLSIKSDHAALLRAVELLGKYAPEKKPMLAAMPEVEGDTLLGSEGLEQALSLAGEIIAADERIRRIGAEESRERAVIESLEPWLPLDLPLDVDGTERSSVLLGSVPVKVSLDKVREALEAVTEESELFEVSADKKASYVMIVCAKETLPDIQEALRAFDFTAQSFTGMSGPARQCTALSNAALERLGREKAACEASIVEKAEHRDELKLAADRLAARLAMSEAGDLALSTEGVALMQGWVPAEKEAALEEILSGYDCAWECEDPPEEDYPEVPVSLKNNKLTNALNMVTEMYSLPAYGTVDPNPLMAPFFILFFGLMMADIGYGLIMIAAALVAMKKLKPRGSSLAFCQLLLYGGIATLAMGVLTGGFFSDVPYQLVHLINPKSTWPGLWHLFSPETDSNLVLYGSLVLGMLHLNTGMVVSAVQKVKNGDKAGALFEEGSLWILLVGGLLLAADMMIVKNSALHYAGLAVLIVGAVMLLFGAGRNAKGFGKVTAAFGCIYNTATGWFGDVLSYSRIMALMLAGGVVGKVFNTVAVMPAQSSGVNVLTMAAFVLIFVLGHAINFALNILGCYVHDLRLQCLEFFGKFYSDGGKPFRPLKFGGKYVRAKET